MALVRRRHQLLLLLPSLRVKDRVQHVVHVIHEHELQLRPHLLRYLSQVFLVLIRKDNPFEASAVSGKHLITHGTDG